MNKKIKLIDQALEQLYGQAEECRLCPRECGVNRTAGETGYCGAGREMVVYDAFLHKGEEPPISGDQGSGTVFFSGCSLKCIFCQNYRFSHEIKGKRLTPESLADLMLSLQEQGAHNINLVTPTHFLPQILQSLKTALKKGLDLPIIYNSSGYEKASVIKLLKGIIDIYLPDFKYIRPQTAFSGSKASNYPEYAEKALTEMFLQQKTALLKGNLLKKGLIIRHLVLPGQIEESKEILSWIKINMPETMISVMFQYRPYFQASGHPILGRPVSFSEFQELSAFIKDLDLEGWVQDFNPPEDLAGIHFSGF